jgi:hypothetical protein
MSTLKATLFSLCVAAASLVSACGPAHVGVVATAAVEPRLVWVSPGIWIVEDSPVAVYFIDGFYWRFVDGIWYRSSWYDDGFARVDVRIVPRLVVSSYNPRVHVRYRAPAHVHVRPIHRTHRSPRRRR